MNLGTSIVGLALLAICITPLILMGRSKRKREKKTLNNLLSIAAKYNCKITRYDLWRSASIGIDDTNAFLFFATPMEDTAIYSRINLSEIQSSQVVKTGLAAGDHGNAFQTIAKLELVLTYNDQKKRQLVLEFYNASYSSSSLMGELQLAEKWNKIINAAISNGITQTKK